MNTAVIKKKMIERYHTTPSRTTTHPQNQLHKHTNITHHNYTTARPHTSSTHHHHPTTSPLPNNTKTLSPKNKIRHIITTSPRSFILYHCWNEVKLHNLPGYIRCTPLYCLPQTSSIVKCLSNNNPFSWHSFFEILSRYATRTLSLSHGPSTYKNNAGCEKRRLFCSKWTKIVCMNECTGGEEWKANNDSEIYFSLLRANQC